MSVAARRGEGSVGGVRGGGSVGGGVRRGGGVRGEVEPTRRIVLMD